MNKKKARFYSKPTIKTSKIVVNFFSKNPRFFDSFDEFVAPNVFAQSGGCSTSTGGSCFLANTLILMADGSTKAIQEVQIGDVLKTYNLKTNKVVTGKVKDTITYRTQPGGYYLINGSIYVTGYHRFWVNNRKWKPAEGIKVGDTLLNDQNREVKVHSIFYTQGANDVYNLELLGLNHNYFAQTIVVHNGPAS